MHFTARWHVCHFFVNLRSHVFLLFDIYEIIACFICLVRPSTRLLRSSAGLPPMAFWLNQTGRPILLSCEYPLYQRMHSFKVGCDTRYHHSRYLIMDLRCIIYYCTFVFSMIFAKKMTFHFYLLPTIFGMYLDVLIQYPR